MNDFIKGDTSLIKDLTDEINRLQTKVAELTNNLNIANLELANKEQQRLDTLNDNKYYKKLCSELTQQLTETNKLMQEYLNKCLSLEQQLAERQKKTNFKICRMCEQEFEQLQNQKAIAELEKVKELIKNSDVNYNGSIDCCESDITEIFDQKIKVLKGEK